MVLSTSHDWITLRRKGRPFDALSSSKSISLNFERANLPSFSFDRGMGPFETQFRADQRKLA